ncbi:MAG: thioredoxin-disulfide reductase [Negativicutes bacterium]|jgi:thioredoxin reductase (NADPH)
MYDVIIIGAGPAGLTAALYAGRAKLNTLVISFGATGGQLSSTAEIENFPGVNDDPTGVVLAERFERQALKFGMQKITAQVLGLITENDKRGVQTDTGSYFAKTIIIASGAMPRSLNCPGEKEFYGMGVSFCAICDAAFYEGASNVIVVGGGDAAVEEAIYLTKFTKKVTIVHRRNELRATKTIQDRAFANPKISFVFNSVVETINGNGIVEAITLKNVQTNELTTLATEGVFLYVGMDPNTKFASNIITINNAGYIVAEENTVTNVPGIFAAGDCRVKQLRQVVTAAADGAVAAIMAEKYISDHY